MAYLNNSGQTVGPLQIENSGTWLTHNIKNEIKSVRVSIGDQASYDYTATEIEDEEQVIHNATTLSNIINTSIRYLTSSRTKNITGELKKLSPLMAAHPLCGTYPTSYHIEDDVPVIDGWSPFCDLNAVATVGWVMSYATLKPGEQALDLNNIIYRDEFSELSAEVSRNTNSIDGLWNNVNDIRSSLSSFDQRITAIEDKVINWETEGIIFIGWQNGHNPSEGWT